MHRREACNQLQFPPSLHPLLQQVYRHREIANLDELELNLNNLLPPDNLTGMKAAVTRLLTALTEQQKIIIVGDFDADGATSCALAILALRSFGHNAADYIVPNRFEYGYGLTPEIVALALKKSPDMLITVDNGIASTDGVAAANSAGVDTLITDHHLPGKQLPAAAAIVNPNQPGCNFASKNLAGAGVIFYVMLALRSRLRETGWFKSRNIPEPNMAELLDLVALGTIADVVPLDWNNRILVNEGLKRIRANHSRPGILALLKVARRNPTQITAADLGFKLGPRLNAAGRLDDMSIGIECLLSTPPEAIHLATQLDELNRERRTIEAKMRKEALEAVTEIKLDEGNLPTAICLFQETWHQGVLGIVAAHIKERYHRPVIVFAKASDARTSDTKGNDAKASDVGVGDTEAGNKIELKGSARSITGFHIRDALDAVATQHPGLISKFGGHSMAAGLSLSADNFAQFQTAFTAEASRQLDESRLQARVSSDGSVAPDNLNLLAAEALTEAGPWGQGFPQPVFDGTFQIIQQRRVGERHLKLSLHPPNEPQHTVDAIAFNVRESDWPADTATEIHIAYHLEVNEYRNTRQLQLLVRHIFSSQ
ncbi:MAG: DHH family phosphoesterase [Pseudohongiellaceae bacterium]